MTTIHRPAVHRPSAHLDVAARVALGREARTAAPRRTYREWTPAPDRRDPVAVLEEQAESRVAELVPLRYGRMLASPFAFYRGGAAIMAHDLAGLARTGLRAQLCGDAHLSNFGLFAAPDRRLVFSINDFDETLPGPFEWDVARLVASFAVAARSRGFDDVTRHTIELTVGRSYREAMRSFADMRSMDVWYARLDADDIAANFAVGATTKQLARLAATIAKARSKDGTQAIARLTSLVDGELRFRSEPPLLVPIRELVSGDEADRVEAVVLRTLRGYRTSLQQDRRLLLDRFRYVDLARKVVGVGSVGTRAWVLLLVGRDEHDALVLQVKEAQASVLEPFLGASAHSNHGQRVVEGQRLMQSASDVLLGWNRNDERDFYTRQLWDSKGSANVERMIPDGLRRYASMCGWTLAHAHARSGDPIAISAYVGTSDTFDRSMAAFAEAYADQNEADHARLAEAVSSGRLAAATEAVGVPA